MTYRRSTAWGLGPDGADDRWQAQGSCRNYDPEVWFPVSERDERAIKEAHALEICQVCPVRRQCGEWAVQHGVWYGVWGMTQQELRDRVREGGFRPVNSQASKTHCVNGHEFTSDNTYMTTDGHRRCKSCSQDRNQGWYQRRAVLS